MRQTNYYGASIQVTWRPGNRKAICTFVESAGRSAKKFSLWGLEGGFVVLPLDARWQVLTVEDRRNGTRKFVSKLALLAADSCLLLLHLTCVFSVFLLKSAATGHLSSQHGQRVMAALFRFFLPSGRLRHLCPKLSRFDGFCTMCSLWLEA